MEAARKRVRPSRLPGAARGALWRAVALLALGLLTTGTSAAAQEADPEPARALEPEPIPAVWKQRDLYFSYASSTSVYSCTALAGRVASILREIGARDDVKVQVDHCNQSILPPDNTSMRDPVSVNSSTTMASLIHRRSEGRQFVYVHARLMMPTEVTPEVMAELKLDKKRRELVSHVTGNPALQFNDPIMFAAQRQPVTLSHKTIGLAAEECELLDQMSMNVFRELDVRVLHGRLNCSPGSRIPPMLELEALVAAGSGRNQQKSAAGKPPADPGEPAVPKVEPATPVTDRSSP